MSLKPLYVLLGCGMISACQNRPSPELPLNPQLIAEVSGLENLSQSPGVFHTSISRPDWITTSEGVYVTPELGLNSDVTIQGTSEHALMLADWRLPENQVNAALGLALTQGFEIQSLHNTYLGEQPRIMSLHLIDRGREREISDRLKSFTDSLKELPQEKALKTIPSPIIHPQRSTLDPKTMAKVLWQGRWNQGVYTIERGRGTSLSGTQLGGSTGVKSWASFAGSPAHAVMTGDIATIYSDLNEILKTLMAAKIKIVSIHTHLNQETPRMIFVHFWGVGSIESLGHAFREAVTVNEKHQSN